MNLRNISDKMLLENTSSLAQKERDVTLEVLHHLREVERRSLFAKRSYSSLFEYAVKELKYSEGSAHRRISSMRLLKELPEIEAKLENGKLSLSALAQAQSFFKQEKTDSSQKREVLSSLENKSTREVEKELVSRSSEPVKLIPEKLRAVSAQLTELKILVEDEFLQDLERLRALVSNQLPGATMKDVLSFAVRNSIKTQTPKSPKVIPAKNEESVTKQKLSFPAQKVVARHIPVEVKRAVWHRDGGNCTFSCGGRRCTTKHQLEFDHIKPFSVGGEHSVENLRLRCRTHNQFTATAAFGKKKMSQFVPRMR